MSYADDEELKIGDPQEDDDLDLDHVVDGPLDDDLIQEDDEELAEGFADLDGASY